jgi:hypothetical protein
MTSEFRSWLRFKFWSFTVLTSYSYLIGGLLVVAALAVEAIAPPPRAATVRERVERRRIRREVRIVWGLSVNRSGRAEQEAFCDPGAPASASDDMHRL